MYGNEKEIAIVRAKRNSRLVHLTAVTAADTSAVVGLPESDPPAWTQGKTL